MPLLDALTNIYGNGGAGDPLISIGMGLLSRRGGEGLAQGFQNVAAMTDLSNQRKRQNSLDKLAQDRETRQQAWQEWQQKNELAQQAQSQMNADRSFGLQQQQFNANQAHQNQPSLIDVPQADGTTQKQWITPGGAPGAAVGAPVKQHTAATDALEKENAQYEARKAQLTAQGLGPNEERNKQFLLTGKFPREDAQPLTPTDKKAILEADEMVQSNEQALDALKKAREVSPNAYGGFGASMRSALGTGLPDWMVPDRIADPKTSAATQDLDNIVVGNALNSLKSIFGGNPTEGERAILLQLQGAASQPDAVRQKIYERAQEMAQRRLEFNKQRANQLRGGTYYNPGSGVAPAGNPSWSIDK